MNHRCAGEWITIDMSRLAAVPRSRFLISNVRRVRARQAAQRTGVVAT